MDKITKKEYNRKKKMGYAGKGKDGVKRVLVNENGATVLKPVEVMQNEREKARAEFFQLRDDDKDFASQYGEDEFEDWYREQGSL